MTAFAGTSSLHPFHPFKAQAYSEHSPHPSSCAAQRNEYRPTGSTSTPASPRPQINTLISIPPEFQTPRRVLRKTPSTSALHHPPFDPSSHSLHPMPNSPQISKNRQRAPTPAERVAGQSHAHPRPGESFSPFEAPMSMSTALKIDKRRSRKHSQGGFFSMSSPPLTVSAISSPSSTVRLSSDPTRASAQLGFAYGCPVTPPDLPSIHGVFEQFDAGPARTLSHVSIPSSAFTKRGPSAEKPARIDTSASRVSGRKGKRDTFKLPMMSIPGMSVDMAHQGSSDGSVYTNGDNSVVRVVDGEIDMSEGDLVSLQSIPAHHSLNSRHSSSRSLAKAHNVAADPSPVPTYTNFNDWVDPERPSFKRSNSVEEKTNSLSELDLRAIEVLEHFSGHLLKAGWNEELERYSGSSSGSGSRGGSSGGSRGENHKTRNPKSAPAVPAKSKLRNQQQQHPQRRSPHKVTAPVPVPTTTTAAALPALALATYAEWGQSDMHKRDEYDAGSMRLWREARKKSKPPPTLSPLSEQPPTAGPGPGLIRIADRTSSRAQDNVPHSPVPPRSSSLTPNVKLNRPSVDGTSSNEHDAQSRDLATSVGSGSTAATVAMRRVSSALSRMSSEDKRRPKVKLPLGLDRSIRGGAADGKPAQVNSSPTSPVPIQHRPLPPVPIHIPRTKTPSRANSSGASALLKFQRGLLRPRRSSTAPQGIHPDTNTNQGRHGKLSAREEPHPGSPLSPQPTDVADKRRGMTALSFLAMNETEMPLTHHNTNGRRDRRSLEWNGEFRPGPSTQLNPIVEHILPPSELSKIVSEKERRSSWSSSSSDDSTSSERDPMVMIPCSSDESADLAQGSAGDLKDPNGPTPTTSPGAIRKSVSASLDRAKAKKKAEYRKSSGQASLSMSMSFSSSYHPAQSPLSPSMSVLGEFDPDEVRRTALPPPPRPRYSLPARRDPVPRHQAPAPGHPHELGYDQRSIPTPPMPNTLPLSPTSPGERPQTFMALSSDPNSALENYSPIPTRPTSPMNIHSPVSPISLAFPISSSNRHTPSPLPTPLSRTPEPPETGETPSPVVSLFGYYRRASLIMEPGPTLKSGSGPNTSLVSGPGQDATEFGRAPGDALHSSIGPGRYALGDGSRDKETEGSISTTATSRRDAEREERDRALKEWLKMKPKRGRVGS